MSKKEQIEYQDPMSRSYTDLSQFRLSLSNMVDVSQNLNQNMAIAKQQTNIKSQNEKTINLTKKQTYYVPQFRFKLSIDLINLFRKPEIISQQFDQKYLAQINRIVKSLTFQHQIKPSDRIYIIYMHLVFSMIENLQQLKQLGTERDKIVAISRDIQRFNILNAHCIFANVKLIDNQNNKSDQVIQTSKFTVQAIFEKNIISVGAQRLSISLNYIDKALSSYGQYDLHFSAFVAHKLNFSPLIHYFAFCTQALDISIKYSEQFEEMMEEQDIKETKAIVYEQWYKDQIANLINGNFSVDNIRTRVLNGERNVYIQKLLIGLQGWNQKLAEESVILLNVYYDNVDWQFNSPFKPVISQVGQQFQVHYLIQNSEQNRKNLIFCLKAPCMDKNFRQQVFSWHHMKVKQYTKDDDIYLWIRMNFQKFKTCGYYDWKLFELSKSGNKEVNKIVNLSDEKKLTKSTENKQNNIYSVRPVQGRFIVHPQNTRKLQIHEIYMDSLSCLEGSNRIPTFTDATKDISRYAGYGINCAYLMGVFQRDSGKFSSGYKRPQASPMALTSRTSPCTMLGGQQSFNDLMKKSKQVGMKIITDCTDRVSSSRYDNIYSPYILHYIDESGRKYPFYGCEGRSINYEDTMLLNYRKLQAWNLLIDQTAEVINKYKINGIYLDNGISWPQLYEIDLEEMLRKDKNNSRVYNNIQIFEGHIVNKNKNSGYWTTKNSLKYPNPFYIKITKTLWEKFDNLTFVCDSFQISDNDQRTIMVIHSGLIPRVYKMTKAVAQIVGVSLNENGTIGKIQPKNVTMLKKWYEEVHKFLPQKAILIQSTSSHAWPYPAFIFKKATWAFVDLIFFLPEIPMTFIGQQDGKAYRTKTTSIFFESAKKNEKMKNSQLKRLNSSFFNQNFSNSEQKIISSVNATIKDPTQIKYLEDSFRREVGPQFGFDLAQIYQHYKHRRQLRSTLPLLSSGKLLPLTAEHNYGVHKNVLSFAKWNTTQILVISINFNSIKVDMHYNFTNFKYLFTNPFRSNLILELEVIMGKNPIKNNLFTVSQLITSRLQFSLQAYQSTIWKIKINNNAQMSQVYQHSSRRMIDQIISQPPKWIYSSIFTNQISNMLDTTKSLKSFATKLQFLYEKFIIPNNLNFSLVISKTHQFWLNRNKLSKLFGVFKLIEQYPQLNVSLKNSVKQLIEGNSLGPIAFVTPQIGGWSSVGGLGVMVDQLSKQLAKIGQQVYIITPYYEYNKKKQTNYLVRDGFKYDRNIKVQAAHLTQEFGIHLGKYHGVNYIWFHNPQLFSKPYEGQGCFYVTKQLVFFALAVLQSFCQLKIFPSIIATNDWMCGFVSAYVKVGKYSGVFDGTKFMHIVHNLDPLYQGRLYPKFQQGDLNWLIQLPSEWYVQYRSNKLIINPSKCALQTCDNWGTVSNSYKFDLLKQSPLSHILWKHPNPFAFPNGVRKDQRVSFIKSKTPGQHLQSKRILQEKYFGFSQLKNDMPLLAFIGRITKQKGVHLIVQSAEQLLHQFNFKIQFLVGGGADSKQQYGKYCADRLKQLTSRYPKCFWSNPDMFFTDGPLANIGSDFALMPSLFQPGGIVQHQFFCGGTPVIAFRTGGLKDTVFQYDHKTQKGNGFNFMSYDQEDFKRCVRRAIQCYKNKAAYQKIRQNAFDSVIEEQDVAKGWNTQFYRLQNKVYIDWKGVEKEITALKENDSDTQQKTTYVGQKGQFWCQDWDIRQTFKAVLLNAQRLKTKQVKLVYQTQTIPRPKDVSISGNWDEWKEQKKMKFDREKKNWIITLKLKPGTYNYKYFVDNQWVLNKAEQVETDLTGNQNHIVVVE